MAYSFCCGYEVDYLQFGSARLTTQTHTPHATRTRKRRGSEQECFFFLTLVIASRMDLTAVRMAFSLFNFHALDCARLMRDAKRVIL